MNDTQKAAIFILDNARQRIIEEFLRAPGSYRVTSHLALAGIVIIEHAIGSIKASRNYGQSEPTCALALGIFAGGSN